MHIFNGQLKSYPASAIRRLFTKEAPDNGDQQVVNCDGRGRGGKNLYWNRLTPAEMTGDKFLKLFLARMRIARYAAVGTLRRVK